MKKITKILLLGLALVAFSCSDMSDLEPVQPTVYAEYISHPEGTDVNNPSKEDYEIGFSALYRFKVYEDENGLYTTDILSPREVNVSEEVFTIVLRIIDNTNRMIIEEAGCERNRILTRSSEDDVIRRTDCVAVAIAHATGKDYNEVNEYINNECGNNGVPDDNMESIMLYFGLTQQNVSHYLINEQDLKKAIIIFNRKYETWGTHAVNGLKMNQDGSFECSDYQNNRFWTITEDEIRYIFQM